MRNIQIISINHQTHSSEERISLDLSLAGWEQLYSYLEYGLGVEGFVHLKTCNRVELYIDADSDVREEVINKWISLVSEDSTIEPDGFQSFFGFEPCIQHFLDLSAGFKSAIFGDDQILSQLKKAFESARQRGAMSTLLERAYQTIMRFHKQICRETDYRSQTVSLAYQALKSAKNEFGTEALSHKNVLIIGAGDMAAQVVKYLPKFKFGSVNITNRTQSKAERLAQNKNITVVAFDQIDIQNYELIISCIDKGHDLIQDWSKLEYYIDLSLHSSQLTPISNPHILLQDLQDIINEQNKTRMESVEQVQHILSLKIQEYIEWCNSWQQRLLRVA